MVILFLILLILASVVIGFFILVQNPKGVDYQELSQGLTTSSWVLNKQLMCLKKEHGFSLV